MRKSIITAGTALALSLGIAGTASAAVTPVTSLTGDWSGHNKVEMTDHGIHFGTLNYGETGDVEYTGFHGKLKDITDLAYTARYNTPKTEGKDAPYLRVYFTDGKDAIYDPSVNGDSLSENVDHTRDAMTGAWRYDDDCGDGILDSTESSGCGNGDWAHPEGTPGYGWQGAPYSTLVADHGDEQVDHITVSAGDQFNDQVEAVMTRMRVNSDEFNFGATGPQGNAGANGAAGQNGANGTNGTNGNDGVTKVVHDQRTKLVGNTMRTIHASSVKGWKFVKVRASLRGQRLQTHHRAIKVDLRNAGVGSYNVHMKVQYTDKGGKLHTVRSIRALGITRY